MKMRYFKGYFNENSKIEELDISVHCDVNIFDWLVRYLQDPTEPKLELQNIISVLISSEFLGIDDLVEKCLVFVSKHLEEVVKLPIEMSCLSASLIDRLSVKVGLTDLATLIDPKDKLSSKLYQRKVTGLVQDDCASEEAHQLRLCVQCKSLFTYASSDWAFCPNAQVYIDAHGRQIVEHEEDENFKPNQLTSFMRKQGLSWKEIFWKIWASMQQFKCLDCNKQFFGTELHFCATHRFRPVFQNGANRGQ